LKAALIDRYGSNDQVHLADVPVPVMGAMDLLVRVHAAGVNPLDVKTRDGKLKMLLKYQFPQGPAMTSSTLAALRTSGARGPT
jgi:alcohol dehydrogenase